MIGYPTAVSPLLKFLKDNMNQKWSSQSDVVKGISNQKALCVECVDIFWKHPVTKFLQEKGIVCWLRKKQEPYVSFTMH